MFGRGGTNDRQGWDNCLADLHDILKSPAEVGLKYILTNVWHLRQMLVEDGTEVQLIDSIVMDTRMS